MVTVIVLYEGTVSSGFLDALRTTRPKAYFQLIFSFFKGISFSLLNTIVIVFLIIGTTFFHVRLLCMLETAA